MKLNEKLLTKISKLVFLLFAILLIIQIASTSLGWSILTAAFLFLVALWLHKEPKTSGISKSAREQNELINGGIK